ncbi:YHS domain-containing (seleno)protein [Vibrio spartinae]|uniref:YHS domain protein n=1 Tax=Vibrio spartinae TaxID=1918945 RepID=A0A1N6M9E8_9VIBR|nr:YHS domain-containing (seleno)protein [Vibrio spartinae]QMV14682.1 YHS domain protein [Vibrio spartinae]SIO96059.1 YHS domain protein [Vibrio spartinae]
MKKLFAFLLFMVMSSAAMAEDQIYTGTFSNKAVDGYDPVSYFMDDMPVKGKSDFKTEYKGADWYFASQEHLDMFEAEPEKYAPQFGGYCAWAVSTQKDFAPGDPEQWAVVDGKLYLNYNKNVKKRWDSDRTLHIKQANENWPELINK